MSFTKLNPTAHYNRSKGSSGGSDFMIDFQSMNPNRHKPLSKLVGEAMSSEVVLPRGRGPEFRPSSFPSCPILNWMKLYRFKLLGNKENRHYFNMEYYTSVGTTVHEKIQYFMGFTGKMWGHWKCINPSCKEAHKAADKRDALGNILKEGKPTLKYTTENKCPSCKEPMLYIEFTIKFRGTTGHIDGIIKLDNGKWIVMDFKTTSMKKVRAGSAAFPEKKHLHQLPFYTYVMEKKYAKRFGMKIDSFSLIYIPRDNPQAYYEHVEKWDDKWRRRCANRFKAESEKWEAIRTDLEEENFSNVVAHKPCNCVADYKSKMYGYGECIMQDVCFSPSKLQSKLKGWIELHRSKNVPRLKSFEQVVAMVDHESYKKKKAKVISL